MPRYPKRECAYGAVVFLAWVAICWAASSTGLSREGRWFTWDGQPVYLVGVDMQSLAARVDLDRDGVPFYKGALDHLHRAGINKVRIWGSCFFMKPEVCLQPFAYEQGKFDLDRWNETYWERVKDFVATARAKSIVVEYTLFSFYSHTWDIPGIYWNRENNRNGAFRRGLPEFFYIGQLGMRRHAETTHRGHDYWHYQAKLIAKAAQELGPFGNVYFEGFNEFAGDNRDGKTFWRCVYPWNLAVANAVRAEGCLYTAHVVNIFDYEAYRVRPLGIERYWDYPSVDVLGLHPYQPDPNRISAIWHDAQRKGKILQVNESFDCRVDLDKSTREAWGMFLAGGYHAFFHRDRDFATIGDKHFCRVMKRLQVIRHVAESMRFWELSAVDERGREYDALVTTGPTGGNRQVFCKPGSRYIAYFWGRADQRPVHMKLPAGDYEYRWIDVRDGTTLAEGEANGSAKTIVPSPDPSRWSAADGVALLIRAKQAASP